MISTGSTPLIYRPMSFPALSLVVIELSARRAVRSAIASSQSDAWIVQPPHSTMPFGDKPSYLIRSDTDGHMSNRAITQGHRNHPLRL